MNIDVRPACGDDHGAIGDLLERTFGGPAERLLVERLRASGVVVCELVAAAGDTIAGHVMFSGLDVAVEGRKIRAVALAPLAVLPEYQGRGIGTRIVHTGLTQLRGSGFEAVIVLGDPNYYQRFGFDAALVSQLESPYCGPAFMGFELVPKALAGRRGVVGYPEAFDGLEQSDDDRG